MQVSPITDKAAIAGFLRRQAALNAYPLGDLDARFWPDTRWYALKDADRILEIALLYSGMDPPILIAIQNSSAAHMRRLLAEIVADLPKAVYVHLSADLISALEVRYAAHNHGPHHIMELVDKRTALDVDTVGTARLDPQDVDEMLRLYELAYPGHWFRAHMLDYGPYFGWRNELGQLMSVSGVHVYSEEYSVATLGNVVTHPKMQGQGLGSLVNARLCQELIPRIETIGLNVHADNRAASRVYEKLGFRAIAIYEEMTLSER